MADRPVEGGPLLIATFSAVNVIAIWPRLRGADEDGMFVLPHGFADNPDVAWPGVYLIRVHRGDWVKNAYVGYSSNLAKRIGSYADYGSHKRDILLALKTVLRDSGLEGDPLDTGDPGDRDYIANPHRLEIRLFPMIRTKAEEALALESRILDEEKPRNGLPWNSVKSGGVCPKVKKHVRKVVEAVKAKSPSPPTSPSSSAAPTNQCQAIAKSTGKQCRRKASEGHTTCSIASHRQQKKSQPVKDET